MSLQNDPIAALNWSAPERAQQFSQWLEAIAARQQIRPESVVLANADASFRRYLRVQGEAGQPSRIIMDAPPDKENCQPFVHVAGLMEQAGVHAARVLEWDREHGFMLLNDLGGDTMMTALDEQQPVAAMPYYQQALDALLPWQLASRPDQLPAYDEALLRRELQLFPDWYLAQHRQVTLTPEQQQVLASTFDLIVQRNLAAPSVYVHRDFMPRNLMLGETPQSPLGVLDFQDAVYGPVTYDITCLFKDAFLSWPEERVRTWLRDYWELALPLGIPVGPDFEAFLRASDLMGVQRHLKVIGIFARICHRDGKPRYLADVPRFFSYIEAVLARRPELAELGELFHSLGQRVEAQL